MKIIAYSKIPSTTPFVHLGYLAASTTTTRPIAGLLLSGVVILLAGLSVVRGRLLRQRKSPEPTEAPGPRTSKSTTLGLALLMLSGATIWSAYAFGEKSRVYAQPEETTSDRVWTFGQVVADFSERADRAGSATRLSMQEGEYDLFSALSQPVRLREHFMDGWDTPLRLRVTRREGQLKYAVVSAGPDRIVGTQDDITSDDPIFRE